MMAMMPVDELMILPPIEVVSGRIVGNSYLTGIREGYGPARMQSNPQKRKRNRKRKTPLQERRRKTFLTLTGLLMEGLGVAHKNRQLEQR
jgi:hypothetical protein